jgi:hypothetical protein
MNQAFCQDDGQDKGMPDSVGMFRHVCGRSVYGSPGLPQAPDCGMPLQQGNPQVRTDPRRMSHSWESAKKLNRFGSRVEGTAADYGNGHAL